MLKSQKKREKGKTLKSYKKSELQALEVAVIVLDKEAKKVRQKFIFDKKMIHE